MQNPQKVRRWKHCWLPLLMVLAIMNHPGSAAGHTAPYFNYTPNVLNGEAPKKNLTNTKTFYATALAVYDSLHLSDVGLSKKVFEMALKGMNKLIKGNQIKDNILSIIDFSQPSINKRLYVIDLDNYELLFNTWVAHGARSGKTDASLFSNKMSSFKSSLGFYVTGETYNGSNGYSLKLKGVEKGINDYALRRGIVMHGADYVSEDYINSQGYIGRSHGCPAVASDICQPLIDMVKDGTCLFIYHPSATYRTKSRLVK